MYCRRNNCKCEKQLGIKTDCKSSLAYHRGNICKKAGAKLKALTSIRDGSMTDQCCNIQDGALCDNS